MPPLYFVDFLVLFFRFFLIPSERNLNYEPKTPGEARTLQKDYPCQRECEVVHLCPVCFASAARNGYFEASSYCNFLKTELPKQMSEYFSILEENPRAFDFYYEDYE